MLKYSYEYDDLGQLIRENDANKGQTCVYVYDNAGNITLRKVYAYTTAETVTGEPTYTTVYGYTDSSWGDKLTSYDGRAITYDEIGNPLSYYNGVEYTLEWTAGRRLESASFAGNVVSYTYNDEGIRTSKTVGGIVHEYHLAGTQILSEEWNENGIQHLIVYHYDAAGLPIGMTYRNSSYLESECDTFIYVKNLQGDIIKVLDVSGNLLVSYTYDAWGSPVTTTYSNGGASTAARFNPFRYRGYYYDTDTGFYYLNSRYYDSEIGRFINEDSYISTAQGLLGYNMFAYCNNNPVMLVDSSGQDPTSLIILLVCLVIAIPLLSSCDDADTVAPPVTSEDPYEDMGPFADRTNRKTFDKFPDALEYAYEEVRQKGIETGYEYGITIYINKDDEEFLVYGPYTDYNTGSIIYRNPDTVDPYWRPIAMVHCHPGRTEQICLSGEDRRVASDNRIAVCGVNDDGSTWCFSTYLDNTEPPYYYHNWQNLYQ